MSTAAQTGFFRALAPSVHGGVDAAELARHGLTPADVIDFSANQSPLGPSPRVGAALAQAVVDAYPDRDARPLLQAVAAYHGLAPSQVIAGNGSTELIRLIAQLALSPGDRTLALGQTFGEYAVATELASGDYLRYELAEDEEFTLAVDRLEAQLLAWRPRLCWWCAPNNPTGTAMMPEAIARSVSAHTDTLFVLDEAYCDLLPAPQWTPELLAQGNLIILRSMTKAWGLAGLRLGYALGAESLMAPLREAKPPWNVNACAQAAGIAALADQAHYARTVALLREQKAVLQEELQTQGWAVLPSAAAFFLVRVGEAAETKRRLLAHGCLVRDCTSFGLPEHIRISPRLPEQNRKLLLAMAILRQG